MDPQTRSPLEGIPIEILLRTTRHLNTKDLGAMRLTCRHIERSLFISFGNEFFRKKQFMLSDQSLQALLDISRDNTLSPLLQHVIIGLDQFEVDQHRMIFDRADQAEWYRAETGKQFNLINTGGALRMLVEAFQNLKNLKTVDIRDFNASSRSRDGPDAQWTSYGITTVFEKSGVHLRMASSQYEGYASVVFTIIMTALAEAGVRIPNIEVLIRRRTLGLTDFAFSLPRRGGICISDVVSTLQKLHLDVDLNFGCSDSQPSANTLLLRQFLSAAHNLTWLRLNFQRTRRAVCDAFIKDLSHQDSPSSPIPLSKMERFDIGHAQFSPSALAAATTFPSLKWLNIWTVTLFDESAMDNEPNLWADVFNQLAKTVSFTRFSVGPVGQQKTRGTRYPVHFHGRSVSDYSGLDIGEYLENLAIDTHVQRPPAPTTNLVAQQPGSEDSEDDEDSEGIEDDDE